MRFTIDTETDSYEDAIRTVHAAYGKPQPEPGRRPEVQLEDGRVSEVRHEPERLRDVHAWVHLADVVPGPGHRPVQPLVLEDEPTHRSALCAPSSRR